MLYTALYGSTLIVFRRAARPTRRRQCRKRGLVCLLSTFSGIVTCANILERPWLCESLFGPRLEMQCWHQLSIERTGLSQRPALPVGTAVLDLATAAATVIAAVSKSISREQRLTFPSHRRLQPWLELLVRSFNCTASAPAARMCGSRMRRRCWRWQTYSKPAWGQWDWTR